FLLRPSRGPTRNVELALAVCLALQISVRYVNFVFAVGPLILIGARRRWRSAGAFLAAAVAATLLVLALPQARGIPYKRPTTPNAVAPTTGPAVAAASIGVPPGLRHFCYSNDLAKVLNLAECL